MKTCINIKIMTQSSPTVRTALNQIHKNFVVLQIDKVANNVALLCKHFYVSVITKELGLGNNDKTSTYEEINYLQSHCH